MWKFQEVDSFPRKIVNMQSSFKCSWLATCAIFTLSRQCTNVLICFCKRQEYIAHADLVLMTLLPQPSDWLNYYWFYLGTKPNVEGLRLGLMVPLDGETVPCDWNQVGRHAGFLPLPPHNPG